MKIVVDTNIILDQLLDREDADSAEQIMEMSEKGEIEGFFNASSATDIYFILKKPLGHSRAKELLNILLTVLDVIDIRKTDLQRAMELDFTDYEDALAAACAKKVKADYIVTRNGKDFKGSAVPAVSPADFLKMFS
jgi:predicted nucleic acid-binding protein